MGRAEDLDKHVLVHIYPVRGGETASGAPAVFDLNDEEEAGHETLEEVEHIADGLDAVSERRPHGTVEDHLPLHAALWGEKGGSMYGELELHGWAARHAGG